VQSKRTQKLLRFDDELLERLLFKASEEGISFNELISKTSREYLSKDVAEFNIVMTKLEDFKGQIKKVENQMTLIFYICMRSLEEFCARVPKDENMPEKLANIGRNDAHKIVSQMLEEMRKSNASVINALMEIMAEETLVNLPQ